MNIQNTKRSKLEISEIRRKAGRKGGLTTISRYSHEQRSEWCKKGGHPKAQCLKDIPVDMTVNKRKEDKPSNLQELKERSKALRLSLLASCSDQEGGKSKE